MDHCAQFGFLDTFLHPLQLVDDAAYDGDVRPGRTLETTLLATGSKKVARSAHKGPMRGVMIRITTECLTAASTAPPPLPDHCAQFGFLDTFLHPLQLVDDAAYDGDVRPGRTLETTLLATGSKKVARSAHKGPMRGVIYIYIT